MADTVTQLAQNLRPFWLRDVAGVVGVAAGAGAALTAHALDSPWHTGQLAESQALWASTKAELAAHALLPDVHHAQVHAYDSTDHTGTLSWSKVNKTGSNLADLATRNYIDLNSRGHVLATTTGLGADHTTNGLTAGQVLRASGATNAAFAQLSHSDLGGVTADQHHAQVHGIISTDHTVTGSQWQIVGLVGANTLGLITPSANPGAAQAILMSTSAGLLMLPNFTATTGIRTPSLDTASGSMTVQPAADLLLSPVSNLVKLATGKAIQTNAFTSGWAGAGSRLDDGLSVTGKTAFEVDELTVRGRMRVYELLINQIRTTNGSMFVSSSGRASAVSGAGPYTVTTETDHGFLTGDLVRAQRFTGTSVYRCDLQVTGVGSTTQFTGTLQAGADAPVVGMTFARLGSASDSTRRGSIYLSADDSGAPFIDVVDGIAAFTDWNTAGKIKVRVGKLTGITGQAGEYGFIAGSGFTSADNYMRLSSYTGAINNIPLTMAVSGTTTISISPTAGVTIRGTQSGDRRINFIDASDNQIGYIQTSIAGSPKYNVAGTSTYLTMIAQESASGLGAHVEIATDNSGGTSTAHLVLEEYAHFYSTSSKATLEAGSVTLQALGSGNQLTVSDSGVYATGALVWHAANFNPAAYAALAGATFTGQVVFNTLSEWYGAGTSYYAGLDGVGGFVVSINSNGSSPRLKLTALGVLESNGNTVWHAGNLTPGNYAPLAGATFTGSVNFPNSGIWNSSGNVGIGTATPIGALHVVEATDYGIAFRMHSAIGGAANTPGIFAINTASNAWRNLAIESNQLTLNGVTGGNVGIGTTSPQRKLHVAGTILVDGDEGGYAGAVGFTDVTSASVTNTMVVKGSSPANTVNAGWLKIYIGTTAAWIPYWT